MLDRARGRSVDDRERIRSNGVSLFTTTVRRAPRLLRLWVTNRSCR